ncbi:MAG: hypothetical protein ACHQ15_06175 [Candidatus Limnocylindrales bacterium]
MSTLIQAYTHEGRLNGTLTTSGRLGDLLELVDSLVVVEPVIRPLTGGPDRHQPRSVIHLDDLCLIVVPADMPTPKMSTWHRIALQCGPYHVTAALPTKPGFDPTRYAIRPGGTFVLLGQVKVSLAGSNGSPIVAEHDLAWVNRYVVDSYQAELDLDGFFPGVRRSNLAATSPRPQ